MTSAKIATPHPIVLAKWTTATDVSLAGASWFLAFTHLWLSNILPWNQFDWIWYIHQTIKFVQNAIQIYNLNKIMKIVAKTVIKNSWALKIVAYRNGHGKQCMLPLASAYLAFCLHVFHSNTISWNTFNSNWHTYILKVKVL